MGFSSIKNKSTKSNVNKDKRTPSSSSNAFACLESDSTQEQPAHAPTSHLPERPSEGHSNRTAAKSSSTPKVRDPSGKLTHVAVDILADDHLSKLSIAPTSRESRSPASQRLGRIEETPEEQISTSKAGASAGKDRAPTVAGTGIDSANWRTGQTVATASGWRPPFMRGGKTRITTNGTRYTTGKIHHDIDIRQVTPGTIIWAKETRECHFEATKGDIFHSKDGQKHFRKGRLFVVTSVHAQSLNKSPMYTYEGKGLSHKPEELKKEHVGIRPLHVAPNKYKRQNSYHPLEIESLTDDSQKLDELTVLHFTKRTTKSFDTPIRVVGRLTKESTNRMLKMCAEHGM